jgi:hypothetical protein
MELRLVHPERLDLSLGRLRQIPEPAVRLMEASLRSKGQLSPMTAATVADGTARLVLVDGFVRQIAARRAGMMTVAVEEHGLSPVQMKAQVYLRNRERGLFLLEECRLVRELVEVDGLSQVEVSDVLERHKSWVCRRLSLILALSPHLVEEAELGRLPPGCLRKLALLPPRNQEQLWSAVQHADLEPRGAERLIDLWRRAPDPEARQFVLEHPAEALRLAHGKPEAQLDARLGPGGEEVRTVLEQIRRASLRLARRMRDGLGPMPSEGKDVLGEACRKTVAEVRPALAAVTAWLGEDVP